MGVTRLTSINMQVCERLDGGRVVGCASQDISWRTSINMSMSPRAHRCRSLARAACLEIALPAAVDAEQSHLPCRISLEQNPSRSASRRRRDNLGAVRRTSRGAVTPRFERARRRTPYRRASARTRRGRSSRDEELSQSSQTSSSMRSTPTRMGSARRRNSSKLSVPVVVVFRKW